MDRGRPQVCVGSSVTRTGLPNHIICLPASARMPLRRLDRTTFVAKCGKLNDRNANTPLSNGDAIERSELPEGAGLTEAESPLCWRGRAASHLHLIRRMAPCACAIEAPSSRASLGTTDTSTSPCFVPADSPVQTKLPMGRSTAPADGVFINS